MAQLEQPEPSTDLPLQPRPADCPVPLTAWQRRTWNQFIGQGRLSVRMGAAALRVLGPLDPIVLRRSLEEVIRRHESVRTRFVAIDGVPEQVIDSSCECHLEEIELAQTASSDGAREVTRLVRHFLEEQVDLSVGPLFAAKLWRLSSSEHVLILALDHMVADAASCAILSGEVWTLYHQAAKGLPFSLPHLPVQFADYAVWQQRTHSAWLKKHGPYWKERLTGAPRLQLPVDDGLASGDYPIAVPLHFPFGNRLSAGLRDAARREGALLPLVVLTVYVAVVSRWCGQRDLVLTFVSHGRHRRPELQNMIGFLASRLFLRVEIGHDDSFRDLLKRVNVEFYSAYEHYDFDRVPDFIPECAADTDTDFNWLPAVWGRRPAHKGAADEQLRIQPFPLEPYRKRLPEWFKLASVFSETAAGIVATVLYRPDLFAADTIERFGQNLRSFAQEFAHHPLAPIASVSLEAKGSSISGGATYLMP